MLIRVTVLYVIGLARVRWLTKTSDPCSFFHDSQYFSITTYAKMTRIITHK